MVRVVLRFFSILREALGRNTLVVDVEDECTIKCVLERIAKENPRFAKALDALDWEVVVLVNGRPASLNARAEGEVTIFPPAAGGACRCKGEILHGKVDLNRIVEWLASASDSIGAVAVFVGVVRGVNDGERVLALEYEHHPDLTSRVLEEIARSVAAEYGVSGVYIGHYVGLRRPGDVTIVVGVAAAHRREAFKALETAVDRVKHQAPIWKTEHRESGRVYIVGDKIIREDEITGTG